MGGRGPGLTAAHAGVIQEGDHFSLSVLRKDPRLFLTSLDPTTLPAEVAVGPAQVWRQRAEVLSPCSFLPNYSVRSNSLNSLNPASHRWWSKGSRKLRVGKSTGMNSINAPVCQAEHTGSHSLIIMPLFTLTHQHKIQGAHCRAHPTSAPLWGALGTPTKPSLKSHLPEAEAHSPGAALIIWNNPCSSQQGLGGVQIPLVSRHNVGGRALLLSFF